MYRHLASPFALLALLASLTACLAGQSPGGWRTPPEPIASLLTAPPPPAVSLSPCRRYLVLRHEEAMPDLAILARPQRKLAGLRLDGVTPGPQWDVATTKGTFRLLEGGAERDLALPAGQLQGPIWNATGTHAAFVHTTDTGLDLWLLDAATAQVQKVPGLRLAAVLGSPVEWDRDQVSLWCRLVVDRPLPEAPAAPSGPNAQETVPGQRAQVRTNPDMLTSEHDANVFEALATVQLARLEIDSLRVTNVGTPRLLADVAVSPDGTLLLVTSLQRPFSFLVGARDFPRRTEVWDRSGKLVHLVAEQPLLENVPIGGVPVGRRQIGWLPGKGHTLRWTEAQDGGDPKKEAAIRDHVYVATEPAAEPVLWFRTEFRAQGLAVAEDQRLAMATEFDRVSRRVRAWRVDAGDFAAKPVLLFERSAQDQYGDPGTPVDAVQPDGQRPMRQRGSLLFRSGRGASPDGERPFLDTWDPATGATTRLWQCKEGRYETFAAFLDDDRVLIRSESPQEPPNYYAVDLPTGARKAVTTFQDPALEHAKSISRELLRYQRADGVALSATLYLPPGHQEGQKHPTLVWAYPQEFTRAQDAGQVRASPTRYTRFAGISHLWLLLAGYAVLDDAAMPIVGPQRSANDTYVEQLVADAEAAVDLLVQKGVCEPHQIAVGGHSYGAFMAANLCCHSDLFAAAIARSGAYNRTLTPFGFQNEERTFWEAQQVYLAMSPFANAQKINEPILLIHGEDDDNQGTWPIQSQRLFAAIKGLGGTARLCMLPYEAHGYGARQSVLHCVWEMVDWMGRHVRDRKAVAPAQGEAPKQGNTKGEAPKQGNAKAGG